jgi:transketolase
MSNDPLVNIRKAVVRMTHRSRSSHIGSCLSTCEILYTLYFRVMHIDPSLPAAPERDRFILSKGHGSAALYATLAERGFFSASLLEGFYCDGGTLPGHLDMTAAPGIEASAGSLGHGLSLGVGMAIANRTAGNPGRVFVLLGDGECNEGSVWEAVMLAATLRLNNLTAIVDNNGLQGFGRTHDVIDQKNLADRWRAFGWDVHDVDGHSLAGLEAGLRAPQQGPKAVIARTVKGKGVCFMEDRLEWHYRSPSDEQCTAALDELDGTAAS